MSHDADGSAEYDPFHAEASERLFTLLFTSPPVEGLLQQSVQACSDPQAGGGAGTMRFDHFSLRGPPGRLHGGLHCMARTWLVASQLPAAWPAAQLFPSAFSVRIGSKIGLRAEVPFRYWTGGDGERRWLVTRFLDTPRLDAALWTLPPDSAAQAREDLRARFAERLREPVQYVTERIGIDYAHTATLTIARFSPEHLHAEASPWPRFLNTTTGFSPALATYYLDNAAAASRMAELAHPCFTTRLGLALFTASIPASAPLVFVASRLRSQTGGGRTKGVEVNGRLLGTETAEVFLADVELEHIYAAGWVDTHPMPEVPTVA